MLDFLLNWELMQYVYLTGFVAVVIFAIWWGMFKEKHHHG